MLDELYGRARVRTTGIASALTPEQLATTVPATPLWTARQLLAHLVGAAADAAAGRVDGVGTPPWTAAQVAAREGRRLDELLAEWSEAGPLVAAALAARRMPALIVHDALTHEADLREAFGMATPPTGDVAEALDHLARGVCRRSTHAVALRAGGVEWSGGEGPATVAETSPYELYRGLVSRRSRAQMRAWTWTGEPGPLIEALPAFGPCAVDQPVPTAGIGPPRPPAPAPRPPGGSDRRR